jgi:hypothetical protein
LEGAFEEVDGSGFLVLPFYGGGDLRPWVDALKPPALLAEADVERCRAVLRRAPLLLVAPAGT